MADYFENNDSPISATDLSFISGEQDYLELTIQSGDDDWYLFTPSGRLGDLVRIDFLHQSGDIDLQLYSRDGISLLRYSVGFGNSEQISLDGLSTGSYLLRVYAFGSSVDNSSYRLRFNTLATSTVIADRFEDNDVSLSATDLTSLSGISDYADLSVQPGDDDWYRFTLATAGRDGDSAQIDFIHSAGDLDLQLYNSQSAIVLRSSAGVSDREEISLSGLAAGSYLLRVYGFGLSVGNPSYRLRLNIAPGDVGSGADRYEQNDSALTATDLLTINGAVEYPDLSVQAGDDDWYRFSLTSGGRVGDVAQLDFVHALGDVDLQLYDASGANILRTSAGVRDAEEISLSGLAAGSYLLRVYGFGSSVSNPSYRLRLNVTPGIPDSGDRFEQNDSAAYATDFLTLSGTQEYNELSVQAGDDDWYRFSLATAGRVGDVALIDFVHALGDIDLQLYNATGTAILRSAAGVANREEINLSGLAAGSYLLRVYGYNSSVSNPNYRLRLSATSSVINTGDLYEQNDSPLTARDLLTPSAVNTFSDLSIQSADEDWFRLTLAAPGRAGDLAQIQFVHVLGDLDLQLYDATGTTLLRSSAGVSDREEITLSALAAGSYLLRVYGYSLSVSNPNYRLQINLLPALSNEPDQFEQNDTPLTATDLRVMSAQQEFSGLNVQSGDDDWYRFNLAAAGRVGDVAQIEFLHALGDIDLQLYEGTGTTILRSSAGVSDREEINLSGLGAGSYLLRVYAITGSTGNPNYRLRFNVSPAIIERGDIYEDNDRPAVATDLRTVSGDVEYENLSVQAGDEDWFRFSMVGPGRIGDSVRIDFLHALGDVDLQLYDATGTRPLFSSMGVADFEQIDLSTLGLGTYLLRVYGVATTVSNPSYRLRFNIASSVIEYGDRFEENDSAASATDFRVVSGLQEYNDLSVQVGDDDWYRLTLAAPGRVGDLGRIEFVHALGDLDLQLYDLSGTSLLRSSSGVTDSEKIDFVGLAAGSYLLRVYGYSSSVSNAHYRLSLNVAPATIIIGDRFEDNDSAATPADLRTPDGVQEYDNLSMQAGDEDWYRFSLAGSGRVGDSVRIEFIHALGDIDLKLYDSTGTTLLRSSAGVADGEEISLLGLASGSYLLRVYGYTSSVSNSDYLLRFNVSPESIAVGDRFESNDTAVSATDLRVLSGEQQYSDLSVQAGDNDWFRFTLAAAGRQGDVVRIDFVHALGDIDLQLYNADGISVLRSSAGVGDREEIDLAGLAAGTYLARVYGFSTLVSNPSYQLRLNASSSLLNTGDRYEENDSAAVATDLRIISGLQQYGDLSVQAGDDDWYRFSLSLPGRIGDVAQLEFTHALGDLDFQLYDSTGITLLRSSLGTSDREDIDLSGLAADSYLLRVYGFASSVGNPSYQLRLNVAPSVIDIGDRYEDNDTPETATDLRILSGEHEYTDLNVQPGDDDWYRFTLTGEGRTGDSTQIDFVHALGDIDVELYDASGATVLRSSLGVADSEGIDLYGLAAGSYLLRVYGSGTAISNPGYKLFFNVAPTAVDSGDRFERNDTAATATDLRTLSELQDYSDLSVQAGDNDWFRFRLAANGRAGDAAQIDFIHDLGDLDLELYNATGQALLRSSTGVTDSETLDFSGLQAGSYLLRVSGYTASVSNPNYRLRISAAPSPDIPLLPDRFESNDTASTATLLRESSVFEQGLTLTSGDEDWFQFSLARAGVLADRVSINADTGMKIQLFDAASRLLEDIQSDSGALSLSLAAKPVGDYRLRVTPSSPGSQATYNLRVESTPVRASGFVPVSDQTWTLLIYINGDNNLEKYALLDINQMEAASLGSGVRIAIEADRIPGYDRRAGDWTDARRGIIANDSDLISIGTTLASIGEVNMGTPSALTDFINWGVQNAPADNYALVIWNHGGGALRGSSFDDSQALRKGLSVGEIRQAIGASSIGRVNLLGFDACFMAAAEQAYEASFVADRLVGSIKTTLGDGWDYGRLLGRFAEGTSRSVDALAASIVDSFGRFYGPSEYLSSVDLRRLSQLSEAIDNFAQIMLAAPNADWLAVAAARASCYQVDYRSGPSKNSRIYVDLGSFMAQLVALSGTTAVDAAASRVITALQAVVPNRTGGRSDVLGLSVVFPESGSLSKIGYLTSQYTFLQQTRWDDFLTAFLSQRTGTVARSVGPGEVDPISPLPADFAETQALSGRSSGFLDNDIPPFAFDLGSLSAFRLPLASLAISSPEDLDWFRFELPADLPQTAGFVLQADPPAAGIRLALLDADGIELSSSQADVDGRVSLGLASLPVSRRYFMRISSQSAAAYALRYESGSSLGRDAFDAENRNDSPSKATPLADADELQLRGIIHGLSMDESDTASGLTGGDWFRVGSVRTTEINASSVKITGASGLGLFVYSYSPDRSPDLVPLASAIGDAPQKQVFFEQQIDDILLQVRSLDGRPDADYSLQVLNDEPPRLVSAIPLDGDSDVPVTSNIVLTFSEEIVRGSGLIQIRRDSVTGRVVESFPVVDSPRLVFSGERLTIDPGQDLSNATQYYVVISPGSLQDLIGNPLAGSPALSFTTIAPPVRPSPSSDRLFGTSGPDPIDGLAGNDTLDGLAGNDTLTGGLGVDHFIISSGADVVTDLGRGGADSISVAVNASVSATLAANWTAPAVTRNDGIARLTTSARAVNLAAVVSGSAGFVISNVGAATTLAGSALADVLTGGSGHDTLIGLAGNDTLNGGPGNDSMTGGAGADTFVLAGSDVVSDYNGLQLDGVDLAALTSRDLVTFRSVTGTLDFSSAVSGASLLATASASAVIILGGSGADGCVGGVAADRLAGGAGKDTLNGGAGNDTLIGGQGSDTLIGGAGCDVYVFAAGESGQTSGFDVITSYSKGVVGSGDLIDFSSGLSIGGSAAAPTATQASIHPSTGVATFAGGSGASLSDALNDITSRFAAGSDSLGEFALFRVNKKGHVYLFISDGTAGLGVGDLVVQLAGVSSVSAVSLVDGNLTILA